MAKDKSHLPRQAFISQIQTQKRDAPRGNGQSSLPTVYQSEDHFLSHPPNHGQIQPKSPQNWWRTVFLTSVGVTTILLGVRELKWLQSWELNAYDQMLQLRPQQEPDPRILLVTITEEDLQRYKWPLPSATVNTMLQKLQSFQPRLIGLNIHRPEKQAFLVGLKQSDNILSVCTFSSMGESEIAPPQLPSDNIGFSDLISDDDGVIRRSLLFAHSEEDKQCTTPYSFAALLATRYLEKQGIQFNFNQQDVLQFGQILLPPLKANSGSYKHLDAAGYQVMLNYRHSKQLAQQVTLQQILENQVDPNLIKDRLVLIGITARSVHAGFNTPYSTSPTQPTRISPVLIHAQITSQILSAVLDKHPQIWYFPDWAEPIWVWGWALVGGTLAWRLRHPLRLSLAGGVTLGALTGICYILFLQAGWVPFVPSALAFVITGAGVMAYTAYHTQQQTKIIFLQVEKQQEAIAQLSALLQETTLIRDQHVHSSPTIEQPEKTTGDFLLSQRYQITQVLGSGGFGRTYLAQDTQRPGHPICVIKQLMPARRDTRFLQVARRLFDAEAEILEVLGKHSQIPQLLAYFAENDEFYLVEEFIPGHPLNEELPLARHVNRETYVVDMLKGILEVLAFVHEHRVIHRDIKPSNIIRSTENRLVLIDFGAVKMIQPATTDQTELATVAIGTRGYAPPEQFAGHPRLCSDIYALGMIAIQAVTGVPPQELHPHPETGTVEWRPRAQISTELAAIIDKMVCYHFGDRYQSATEVLHDLEHIG